MPLLQFQEYLYISYVQSVHIQRRQRTHGRPLILELSFVGWSSFSSSGAASSPSGASSSILSSSSSCWFRSCIIVSTCYKRRPELPVSALELVTSKIHLYIVQNIKYPEQTHQELLNNTSVCGSQQAQGRPKIHLLLLVQEYLELRDLLLFLLHHRWSLQKNQIYLSYNSMITGPHFFIRPKYPTSQKPGILFQPPGGHM